MVMTKENGFGRSMNGSSVRLTFTPGLISFKFQYLELLSEDHCDPLIFRIKQSNLCFHI
jgi:hypothetical protein